VVPQRTHVFTALANQKLFRWCAGTLSAGSLRHWWHRHRCSQGQKTAGSRYFLPYKIPLLPWSCSSPLLRLAAPLDLEGRFWRIWRFDNFLASGMSARLRPGCRRSLPFTCSSLQHNRLLDVANTANQPVKAKAEAILTVNKRKNRQPATGSGCCARCPRTIRLFAFTSRFSGIFAQVALVSLSHR